MLILTIHQVIARDGKKCVTLCYTKVNGKWDYDGKYTETYKYKADKTGKNVGEVIRYGENPEGRKSVQKICYAWKKIKK